MRDKEIDDKVRELLNDSFELHAFVASNSEDLSDDEIDDKVRDLENDSLELREYVMNVLGV